MLQEPCYGGALKIWLMPLVLVLRRFAEWKFWMGFPLDKFGPWLLSNLHWKLLELISLERLMIDLGFVLRDQFSSDETEIVGQLLICPTMRSSQTKR